MKAKPVLVIVAALALASLVGASARAESSGQKFTYVATPDIRYSVGVGLFSEYFQVNGFRFSTSKDQFVVVLDDHVARDTQRFPVLVVRTAPGGHRSEQRIYCLTSGVPATVSGLGVDPAGPNNNKLPYVWVAPLESVATFGRFGCDVPATSGTATVHL